MNEARQLRVRANTAIALGVQAIFRAAQEGALADSIVGIMADAADATRCDYAPPEKPTEWNHDESGFYGGSPDYNEKVIIDQGKQALAELPPEFRDLANDPHVIWYSRSVETDDPWGRPSFSANGEAFPSRNKFFVNISQIKSLFFGTDPIKTGAASRAAEVAIHEAGHLLDYNLATEGNSSDHYFSVRSNLNKVFEPVWHSWLDILAKVGDDGEEYWNNWSDLEHFASDPREGFAECISYIYGRQYWQPDHIAHFEPLFGGMIQAVASALDEHGIPHPPVPNKFPKLKY